MRPVRDDEQLANLIANSRSVRGLRVRARTLLPDAVINYRTYRRRSGGEESFQFRC